jgi:hypothetical protein
MPTSWRERIWIDRSLGRVHVHLLELPHDGQAEERDRSPNPRQHRVVVIDRPTTVLEVGFGSGQIDGESQCVEDLGFVTTVLGGGYQTLGTVCAGRPRQDG